ncbi:MAG: hypothetical protein ABJE95_05835 [Byssovorax sp.]
MKARLAASLALGLVAAPLLWLAALPALAAGPGDAAATDASAADADASAIDAGAIVANATDPGDAGADDASAPDGGSVWVSCIEKIPAGATRPSMREAFPSRGLSGYAANLVVTITHGKGETVFPGGIKLGSDESAAKALKEVGFVIPDADGGAPFLIEIKENDVSATTTVTLPFVPLPKDPGRNTIDLPSMPITVSRAGGEVMTLCTARQRIVVEDPIANALEPKVKPNPPARSQREQWELARNLTIGLAIGLVLGIAAAFIFRWYRRRPVIVVAPPPRLPWLTALDELDEIRRSKLIADGLTAEYFDRVSNCVRKYLGARYGFDGLESTTDEMRAVLKRIRPQVPGLKRISVFLEECDLVKFARAIPDGEACLEALSRGEEIVRTTIPVIAVADAATMSGGGAS